MNHPPPALRLAQVSVFHPSPLGAQTILQGVDITVRDGEFLCLVGPTGCGKSTLLNVMAGLQAPSSGTVWCGLQILNGLHREAGYLLQTDGLLPWRTARDNVAAGLRFRGVPRSEATATAMHWLERVGLAEAAGKYPHQLSGGMKKRVALAQILAPEPRILLMDEPFAALDVQTRAEMEDLLLTLWQDARRTVVFVTHDLEEAVALGDRVILMSAGPGSRPVGEYAVDLPRPREVEEIRLTPRFLDLERQIWQQLRIEVRARREGAIRA